MTAVQDKSSAIRGFATRVTTCAVIAGCGVAVYLISEPLRIFAAAEMPEAVVSPLPVSVLPLQLQDSFTIERSFFGEVQPGQRSDLSFELGGRLVDIRFDEGDPVSEGDPIARLDTALTETELRRLEAVRDALEAELDFASGRLRRQETLRAQGYAADEALHEAESLRDRRSAQIEEVDAQIAATQLRIGKSVLRAPFSGQVAHRHADLGTILDDGQPVLRLVDTEGPEIRIGLPLWVSARPGESWDVDVSGRTYTATLRAFLPEISEVTRTRVAVLSLNASGVDLGTVARVRIRQRIPGAGAWVPREALIEGRTGQWSVLSVDDGDIIRRVAVDVLHAEAARLFVAGALEDGMPIVASGPHRVVPGQQVLPRIAGR